MIHFDENKPYNPINYSNGQWIKFGCGFIIVLIVTILGLIINSFFQIMTIITGREFRSNQNKYIGMAHRGERVVISSKSGYAELSPVSKEEIEVGEQGTAGSVSRPTRRKD